MTDTAAERRSSKSPTLVDNYIGRRIQERRKECRLSQTALGKMVGLTFQQIQKFESGINRVPASRLADIATVLKAAPGDFFPPIDDKAPHLRRGDLNQVMEAIADQLDRQKALVDDLSKLYRRLSLLALKSPNNGDANGQ
jgi:transcriptional regulator with XRE-family HTH domain